MARHHWVGLERFDALPDRELKELIKNSYQMTLAKLPRKLQAQLESTTPTKSSRKKR